MFADKKSIHEDMLRKINKQKVDHLPYDRNHIASNKMENVHVKLFEFWNRKSWEQNKKNGKKDASSYNILFLVCRQSESDDAFVSAQKSIADDVLHPGAWFICVIQKLNNVNGMDFIRNTERK